jgi:hypothetical protein
VELFDRWHAGLRVSISVFSPFEIIASS